MRRSNCCITTVRICDICPGSPCVPQWLLGMAALQSGGGGVWSRDIVDTMSRDIVDSGVNYVNGYF